MKKIKKIVIYGDSISTTNHGGGGYENYLKERYKCKIENYAISSSGLSYGTPNNTASILEKDNIPKDADMIIMWHGSNDWYWGSPVGTLDSEGSASFLGAVGECIDRIRLNAPEAVFVWLTPIFRFEKADEGNCEGKAYEVINKAGHTMSDYYYALLQSSVHYGFPLIDMRKMTGIHEGNHERYLEDGVHPNREGYERIWRVLDRELEGILYYAGYEC